MLTGASLTQHWSPHQSRYAEVNIVKYATLKKKWFLVSGGRTCVRIADGSRRVRPTDDRSVTGTRVISRREKINHKGEREGHH